MLALDAILSKFSAKQLAVAALAAKTAENCRNSTRDGTPRRPLHSQAAYVPVQSRARVGCNSETSEKVRRADKRCRAETQSHLHCEHSGASCANRQSYEHHLQQRGARSATRTSRNQQQLAGQAGRTLSRYHWKGSLEYQAGGELRARHIVLAPHAVGWPARASQSARNA